MDVDIYQSLTSAPIRLTGDRPEEGALCAPLSHSRAQSETDLLDAQSGEVDDHGNARSGITFTVTRTWQNEGVASSYYINHADSLPGRCERVVFTHRDAQGNLTSVSEKRNATLLCSSVDWVDGCATTATYQLRWPGN